MATLRASLILILTGFLLVGCESVPERYANPLEVITDNSEFPSRRWAAMAQAEKEMFASPERIAL